MVAGNVDTVSWLNVRLMSLVARGLPLWLLSCFGGCCIPCGMLNVLSRTPTNRLVGGMAGNQEIGPF